MGNIISLNQIQSVAAKIKTYTDEQSGEVAAAAAAALEEMEEVKADKTESVSASLAADGWVYDSTLADYNYYYDLPVEGLTADDRVTILLSASSMSAAREADLCTTCESMADAVRVYAGSVPESDLLIEFCTESRNVTYSTDLTEFYTELANVEEEVNSFSDALESLQTGQSSLTSDLASLQTQVSSLETSTSSDLAELSSAVTALQTDQSSLSGSLSDLQTDVTTLSGTVSEKADLVSGAVSGNFAALDANGNLADSGTCASDFTPTTTAATLAAGSWTSDGTRYCQSVSVSGVTADTAVIIVDVSLTGEDLDADEEALEAWASVSENNVVQGSGTLTFYSADEPDADVPINIAIFG